MFVRDNVKSEVEAALKGSQWPLSCFGPFKDKQCVPFLEDQSCEEIRLLFYNAKQQGSIDNYQHQLIQQINNSKQKLQSFISMNQENLNNVVQIYNGNGTGGDSMLSNTNPFGLNNMPTNNMSNASDLFGKSAFSNQNQISTSNNIFGTQNQASNSQSIFGGGNSSGFPSNSQNIFSSAANMAPSSNIFATENKTSSIFQNQNQNQSVFGNTPTPGIFDKPSMEADTPFNTFGQQPNQTQNYGSGNSNIFGNTPQQQQPQPQQLSNNIFANSPFANPQASSFYNTTQQQQAPPAQNIFGNLPQQQNSAQNPFGVSNQNMFSISSQQPQPQQQQPQQLQQQQPGQQTLSSSNPINHSASIFGNSNYNNPNPITSQQTPFGCNLSKNNTVYPPLQQHQQSLPQYQYTDPSVYSKIEELTEEQKNVFSSDSFDLSSLPTVPPPKEMCF